MRRVRIEEGEVVKFTADTGRSWSAVVTKPPVTPSEEMELQIEGDPFPVPADPAQVRRVCSRCKKEKRLKFFYKKGLGWQHHCKACSRDVSRETRERRKKADPEAARMFDRKHDLKKYGLTPEQYEEMVARQRRVCAICAQPEKAMLRGKVRNLCVDHDHATGKVRGLLCLKCNRAVGCLMDCDINAWAMMRYLQGALPVRDGDPIEVPLSEVACKRHPRRVSSQPTSSTQPRRRPDDMATATPSEAKQLRTRARELGIDYANMTRKDLRDAIKVAEEKEAGKASKAADSKPKGKAKPAAKPKASTTKPKGKKAAAKTEEASEAEAAPAPKAAKAAKSSKAAKKTAKPKGDGAESSEKKRPGRKPIDRSSIEPGTCPFTKGSDRAVVFGLLKKGGNRRKLAEALREKVTLRGEPGINDYDKRLTLVAKTLADEWGYEIQKSGRGLEGKIKVVHPGATKGKK